MFFSSIDEDKDRGWMSQFVRVRTSNIIPADRMPFPEEWNMQPTVWYPTALQNLLGWIKQLDSTFSYSGCSWHDLSKTRWQAKNHGLEEGVLMVKKEPRNSEGARWSADVSQDAGHMVAEPVMVDVDLTHAEKTLEEGSDAVPELQIGHGTVKKLYDLAFSKLQDELSCREKELEKLTSKLNKSEASSTRQEEELGVLRIGQKDALMGQLREEVAAKDAEILELKRQNGAVTSERDLLRGELTSTQKFLQNAKKEVAALSVAKAEAVKDASSHKRDAATANARAREISEKAEQKLAQAVAYARLRARRLHKSVFLSFSTAIPWFLYEVPDLANWPRKLAAYSSFDERIEEFSEMRPCSHGEEEGSSASGSRNDNKRKKSSNDENAHSKASPARRLKRDVSAELAAPDTSSLGRVAPPLPPSSLPVEGTSRDTGVFPLSSFPVKDTLRDTEINILILQLQSKTEDLERLWGEVGQAKYKYNELRAQIDALVAAKKNALAKASSLKVQLQNTHENSLVQTSRIASLESDLLKTKTEVVDVWADAKTIRAKADKKVAIYLKDVVDARAELREASDRESRSNEYTRCKSRRQTLEEIHARVFDLSEKIEQAKEDKYDAKFLVFDAKDNEEGADGAAVPEEKVE
ncbi:COP1-interactive protein 1-like [Nicotiana sylvestris]|uniref:COP1-interactive protein 1-like n=1 Tax=Nicotiana sylvestris TaxID=4096 RepID=UPI00388C952D